MDFYETSSRLHVTAYFHQYDLSSLPHCNIVRAHREDRQ